MSAFEKSHRPERELAQRALLRIRVSWSLHRHRVKGPAGDVILLDDELRIAHKYLLILAASPSELRLQLPGPGTEYTLLRI